MTSYLMAILMFAPSVAVYEIFAKIKSNSESFTLKMKGAEDKKG